MSSWVSREVVRWARLKAVLDLRVRVEGEEEGGEGVRVDKN